MLWSLACGRVVLSDSKAFWALKGVLRPYRSWMKGYISFNLDLATKKRNYEIGDWVQEHSGSEADKGSAYATEGYGFVCLPRSITGRLEAPKRPGKM